MNTKVVEKSFDVSASTDALFCSIQGKQVASEFGFGSRGQWEIAIAVKELATNALAHAGGGRVTIRVYDEEESGIGPTVNLEIEVEDNGPGIEDVEKAVLDGYSRGRFIDGLNFDVRRESLGTGLGSVQRLMDCVRFENKKEGGLRVRASKHLRRKHVPG